ncbi:unnamed protein product [Leuciscus chuanchicus]
MASVADVLTELKSLRSEFSSKLDGINIQLGELTNSVSVMESNLGEIKRDVTANEQRIEEAETRIAATEDALDKAERALAKATKRLTYLEEKTEDLENRGRRKNIRLFGLKEGAEEYSYWKEPIVPWPQQFPIRTEPSSFAFSTIRIKNSSYALQDNGTLHTTDPNSHSSRIFQRRRSDEDGSSTL